MVMSMDRMNELMQEAERQSLDNDGFGEGPVRQTLQPLAVQLNKASTPVTIYETRTGDARQILRHYWPAARRKKHNDPQFPEWLGKPLFSLTPPANLPERPRFMCYLNPKHPDYEAKFAQFHFAACSAAHLPSLAEVESHAEHKHRDEWKKIKKAQDDARQEEGLRLQREMVNTLIAQREQPPRADEQQPLAVNGERPQKRTRRKRK